MTKLTNALRDLTKYSKVERNVENGVKEDERNQKDMISRHHTDARDNKATLLLSEMLLNERQVETKQCTTHMTTGDKTVFASDLEIFIVDNAFVSNVNT